jgi:hypothetical protein
MHKVLGVVAPMRYDSGPRIMTRVMMYATTRIMMLHYDARHDTYNTLSWCHDARHGTCHDAYHDVRYDNAS